MINPGVVSSIQSNGLRGRIEKAKAEVEAANCYALRVHRSRLDCLARVLIRRGPNWTQAVLGTGQRVRRFSRADAKISSEMNLRGLFGSVAAASFIAEGRCGGGRMYSHLHGSGTTNACLTSVTIVKDLVDEREDTRLLLKLKARQEGRDIAQLGLMMMVM